MILVLRLSNSGLTPAMCHSSVVQTGVKSLGCENRMAQLSPIQVWKSIGPCVVLAVKFGASALIRSDISPVLQLSPGQSRRPAGGALLKAAPVARYAIPA